MDVIWRAGMYPLLSVTKSKKEQTYPEALTVLSLANLKDRNVNLLKLNPARQLETLTRQWNNLDRGDDIASA